MQDRFKFRVWKKLENKMVEGVTYLNPLLLDEDIAKDTAKNYVIMQCTGLKDKNGKLIFESDIVSDGCTAWEIKYCEDCKSFQCFFNNECFTCLGDYSWAEFIEDLHEYEVIGNIYENKELLNA